MMIAMPPAAQALENIDDGGQPVLVEPLTGMHFIALSGGCTTMPDIIADELCVDDFAIGRFEVTNRQFKLFDASHQSGRLGGQQLDLDEQPAVNISWIEANAFAQWLSEETGLAFRLPTETEWQYAAAGGIQSRWFWGSDPAQMFRYANLSGRNAQGRLIDGFEATAPIASFDANPFGLFDMLGNASEWTADSYSAATNRYQGQTRNPLVTEGQGPLKVRRGGSFDQTVEQADVFVRDFYLENLGVPQTGFRLVLELDE